MNSHSIPLYNSISNGQLYDKFATSLILLKKSTDNKILCTSVT